MDYKQAREQRLKVNKRRLEELGLAGLSQEIMGASTQAKIKKTKSRAAKTYIEPRRSSRVAGTEKRNYSEMDRDLQALPRRGRFRRDNLAAKFCDDSVRVAAFQVAERVEQQLADGCPCFVKAMLKSHIAGGFWLGLPSSFCCSHMPKADQYFTLQDEKNEEWQVLYLAHKTGLSGGWRGFAIDHSLEDGDALVFELIEKHRFKVYIVRAADHETCPAAGTAPPDAGDTKKVSFKLTPSIRFFEGDERKQKSPSKSKTSNKENLPLPLRRSSRLNGK